MNSLNADIEKGKLLNITGFDEFWYIYVHEHFCIAFCGVSLAMQTAQFWVEFSCTCHFYVNDSHHLRPTFFKAAVG